MPPLIHLTPRPFTSLPSNPCLPSSPSRPDLHTFLHSALTEAHSFLSTTIPQTFHPDPKLRPSPPSTAKVQLSSRSINDSDTSKQRSKADFWVCRRSVHANAAAEGSASWAEFRTGLRENHSENEMAYTPSVSAVERLVQWDLVDEVEGGWSGVDMHVNIITHTFHPSFFISPRTFISLIISANLPGSNGFVTVQIPLSHLPGDSTPTNLRDRVTSSVPKNTIFAAYASVEKVVRLFPEEVEWTMATTSDAGGLVPQWVQRSWTLGGVPKAVVADVGLFIGWTGRNRRK